MLQEMDGSWSFIYQKQEINEPIRGVWKPFLPEFSVVVKDRWGHLSESKEISLTPYYEEK